MIMNEAIETKNKNESVYERKGIVSKEKNSLDSDLGKQQEAFGKKDEIWIWIERL